MDSGSYGCKGVKLIVSYSSLTRRILEFDSKLIESSLRSSSLSIRLEPFTSLIELYYFITRVEFEFNCLIDSSLFFKSSFEHLKKKLNRV